MQQQQLQTNVVSTGQVNPGNYTGQPGPVAVVQMPYGQPLTRTSNVVTRYPHRQSLYLGVTMIVAGALSIVVNIIDFGVEYECIGVIGHGIWSGIMCVIGGGFGVGASRSRTVGMIRAFLVLAVIAASFCLIQMTIGIIGTMFALLACGNGGGFHFVMEVVLAILPVVGGVAAIWGSVLCCQAACCCQSYDADRFTNGVIYYSIPVTAATQQQQQQQTGVGLQQVQLMNSDVQYIQPGQQFLAGPPPPYIVGSSPYSPPYSESALEQQNVK